MSLSRIALGVSALLLAASCNHQNQNPQVTRHQSDQHLKPVVALVPILDNSHNDLAWSVSEELTQTIHHRLSQKDRLYLLSPDSVRTITQKLSDKQNPFSNDLSWVKKSFAENEFVIFLELVEHEEVPVASQRSVAPEELSAELNMSMRVRVVDLRGAEPQIVLQELVHDSHSIPRQFTRANFYQVPWGKESFSISPIGLAHASLSKQVAARLEDYILLAQARK